MSDSFSKKEKLKKKEKKRQDKAQKMQDRKTDNNKGKDLEEMLVYLDHNGNFTTTPPDRQEKIEIDLEDIQLGAAPLQEVEAAQRIGTVTAFFDDKGFGFISDDKSKESLFVHANQLETPIKVNDKVYFDKEKNAKGLVATNVKKAN